MKNDKLIVAAVLGIAFALLIGYILGICFCTKMNAVPAPEAAPVPVPTLADDNERFECQRYCTGEGKPYVWVVQDRVECMEYVCIRTGEAYTLLSKNVCLPESVWMQKHVERLIRRKEAEKVRGQ